MSWYLFQSAPAVKLRGIKVTDYEQIQRPKINLSWGMNQPTIYLHEKEEGNVIPTTIVASKKSYQQDKNINDMKVLTESSESDQDELTKLVKNQNDKKLQQQAIQLYNKRKQKEQSTIKGKSLPSRNNQQQNSSKFQFAKRLRYLENSLLPSCKRDSMATIFDHNLNRQVPLTQSRLSGKSIGKNKKNQSNVVLGNGYNIITTKPQLQKEHIQKLQEMYEYQEKYKKRIQEGHFQLG